ncbi:MAG TPA: MaoC family dehydratase [Bryobacteraceae bacterium]|nr:MaoC family dehydratase [Bryobacteraceae bacterium]
MTRRYLEDLQVGEKFHTASVAVSEAEILEFSREFDPQPMHLDPLAASQGPFRGLIASGWHTGALVMRLVVDANPLGDLPLLGLGVDGIEWPQPVRPGDTLRVEMEVLAIRPSKSTPTHGIVKLKTTARNQHGEVVYIVTPNCWVPRRPA